jgi:hypothetical protein
MATFMNIATMAVWSTAIGLSLYYGLSQRRKS